MGPLATRIFIFFIFKKVSNSLLFVQHVNLGMESCFVYFVQAAGSIYEQKVRHVLPTISILLPAPRLRAEFENNVKATEGKKKGKHKNARLSTRGGIY